MFLLNIGFLANFQEIIGNISGQILQGLNLIFGSVYRFARWISSGSDNQPKKPGWRSANPSHLTWTIVAQGINRTR